VGNDASSLPTYLASALQDLRAFEGRVDHHGVPLPPAYLVVTNRPYAHHLEGSNTKVSAMFEGFQISDFKMDAGFLGPRAAHRARLAHLDIHRIAESMQKHSEIPATFDGQTPELTVGKIRPRLIVGEKYTVPDAQGTPRPGILESAAVMGTTAMGIYTLDTGERVVAQCPLNEAELAAYHRRIAHGAVGEGKL
jgi:hypothetical protein